MRHKIPQQNLLQLFITQRIFNLVIDQLREAEKDIIVGAYEMDNERSKADAEWNCVGWRSLQEAHTWSFATNYNDDVMFYLYGWHIVW